MKGTNQHVNFPPIKIWKEEQQYIQTDIRKPMEKRISDSTAIYHISILPTLKKCSLKPSEPTNHILLHTYEPTIYFSNFSALKVSIYNLRGPPSASHPDFPVAVEGLGQQWDFSVDNCIKFVQEMYTKSSQIIVLECPGVGKKNVM